MKRKAIGVVDVAGLIVALALVAAIIRPAAVRLHEMSRRQQCAHNLQGIGTSCKIYANENSEKWPMPPFKRGAVDSEGIDYLDDSIKGDPTDPGAVGFAREFESTADFGRTPPPPGSTAVSTTRAFWMLVRTGDALPTQFICPSSRDRADDRFLLELYYDFSGYHNISYGYQVPFGPRDTGPREGVDNRMILIADKGPYYLAKLDPSFVMRNGEPITPVDLALRWRPYNSPNHTGLGQNVLAADGHAEFARMPTVGVNSDNIYTHMGSDWENSPYNAIHGDSPHYAPTLGPPYPGQDAFFTGPGGYASTDSLLYP